MVIKFNNETENMGKMRVGTKIIRQLSTSFYPDLRMVFSELVANARDAMSTFVRIRIDEDRVTIEDNGEGMIQEELVKFFYISHSDKEESAVKTRGNIKRELIGKFGIGKLTLYRLCKSFEILSWRNGKAVRAVFDFDQFEKNDYVDQFDLKVEPVENMVVVDSGTRITMLELREPISARDVKRYLQQTMPLTPDFRITISGADLAREVELKSEDLWEVKGKVHSFSDDKDTGVGRVTGKIVFLEKGIKDNGVYIRVFGRLINYGNPDEFIDFNDITHAFSFPRKIMVDVNADGLNEILLTNRSGFLKETKTYKEFRNWLQRTIQKYVNIEYELRQSDNKKLEVEGIPKFAANIITNSLSMTEGIRTSNTIKIMKDKKVLSKIDEKQKNKIEKPIDIATREEESDITIEGIKLKILMKELGKDFPEAIFNKDTREVLINSTHPLYEYARSNGKVWGALYHSVRAAIVLISMELANNLDDFRKIYNKISSNASELLNEATLKSKKREAD